MTTQFVLATRNAHKAEELDRILRSMGMNIELKTVDKFPGAPEVEETEDTFEGNALLKARALCQFTGLPAIADDSGICVDALDGQPGVLSARWSGATENVDQANLNLVLDQIKEVAEGDRGAQFMCAAVAVFPDGTELVAIGKMVGSLLRKPQGLNGFGYDPIFYVPSQQQTFAEMSAETKSRISHRGVVFAQLMPELKQLSAQLSSE